MTAARGAALRQLGVLSVAVVLGMAPWFAATVVSHAMALELVLSTTQEAWLTLAVQLGFVVGSLVSAMLLLSDRYLPRHLAAVSATLAAGCTLVLAITNPTPALAILWRFLTGAALAGVYPPGIKMAAGWTRRARGAAIGALVGAVTLGSATPHLFRALIAPGGWRGVLITASLSALCAAVLFAVATREGPHQAPSVPFDPRALGRVWRERGVVLATGGYLGHMWELYAMWSTIGLFLATAARFHGRAESLVPPLAFLVIGAGAVGSLGAGVWADRIGRSRATIVALAVSGTCALVIGAVARHSFVLTVVIALIWGVSIVADSAQFSACVTELSPRDLVGTAVTLQTALGFLLTMVTIRAVPGWAETWGWTWAYVPLAVGPVCGIACMARLWRVHRV